MTNSESRPDLPDGWVWSTLGEIQLDLSKSIDPRKYPDRWFELYSIPSLEMREPEILQGSEIGSSKRLVKEKTVLVSKINPRINRVHSKSVEP